MAKEYEERLNQFGMIGIGLALGFLLVIVVICFNVGNILGHNGLMYSKDCVYNGSFETNDSFRFMNESDANNLYGGSQLMVGNYSRNFEPSVLIIQSPINSEETMRIYANGSFWIKKGTEQYNGEQLAKVSIAYSSYLKGFCEGIK